MTQATAQTTDTVKPHGLRAEPDPSGLKQLVAQVRDSESSDGCEGGLTVVRKSLLDALLSTAEAQAEAVGLADTFIQELLDGVESLTAIAEEHGARTLADLMYLHSAILRGGFIDHWEGESNALQIVCELPSGLRWADFVQVVDFNSEIITKEA